MPQALHWPLSRAVPTAGPPATFRWNSALGILTNMTLPGPDAPRIFALDKDELGRLRKITLPNGQYATFTRDVAGRVTNRTDPAGRTTRLVWHPAGKLSEYVRDDGGLNAGIRFDYDQQMESLRIRDPLDREVERYALDAIGRATNVWDIENRPMAIRYALGDLVSGIDRFDGSTVSFEYDSGARLSRVSYPDGDLAFTHLACGRPATASNAASRIAWIYDGAGRPTNETAVASLGASALSLHLDASGLPTNTHLNVES